MKKVITSGTATVVTLQDSEAKVVCKLGEGADCCAFLTMSPRGFECVRLAYPSNMSIFKRLKEGTMNAKGKGGWEGCAWKGDL